ncbi:hypothetical protein EBZ38_07580 [bacterium]|jgi:hypothetical protein|nr:hypothetical protein [bacterium]
MSKTRRKVIGSVCKSKDAGKPDYIKIREDVVLKKNQSLRLESKKFQMESLEGATAQGKVSAELSEKIRDRIDKIPDWVRFEIVALETQE